LKGFILDFLLTARFILLPAPKELTKGKVEKAIAPLAF
jgi:hypothetical protein